MIDSSGDDEADRLVATLAQAGRLPFYARRFGRRARTVADRAGLARLPLLDKAEAAAHQEELRSPEAAVSIGVVSSATTREGRPLRVLQTVAASVMPTPTSSPLQKTSIHTLRVYAPRHGVQQAGVGELCLPATLHDNTVDVLFDLLAEHRPAELVLPLSTLKWVSVAATARGMAPHTHGVAVVGVTGYPLTRAARRWLEPLWRAPLVDNWSMSELVGFAQGCRCGFSHWHGAPTLFELVTPAGGKSVDVAGVRPFGELVATTLLPHGAAMPLIRYRSGDLVELGPRCRAAGGRRGMRFRGRTSHSLLAGDVPLALSGDLLELAESLPDVALVPHPAERLGLVPPSDLGVPMLRPRSEGRGARARFTLDVELRFDPARHAGRASEVRAAFAAIVAANVEVVLHRPGSLELTALARKL